LKDEENEIIVNADIIIKVGDKTVETSTDANGNYEVDIPIDEIGTLDITVEYVNSTSMYTGTTKTGTVTVNPRNTTVTVDNDRKVESEEEIIISGTLTDELGNIIPDTVVTVTAGPNTIKDVTVDKNGYYTTTKHKRTGNIHNNSNIHQRHNKIYRKFQYQQCTGC